MATYLYCVRSDRRQVPPGLTGVDDAPVRCIAAGALAAWVSDAADSTVAVSVERLRAHDRVCAAALDGGDTPLPIRFGQTFADDVAAVDALVARESVLARRLARVAGCVEMRVLVKRGRAAETVSDVNPDTGATPAVRVESAPEAEGRGTAFLRRLASEGRADLARDIACEEVRHAVRSAADALIVDQHPCEAARGLSYFPILVRREHVDAFEVAVRTTGLAPAIDLSVLGPFAPYSFSTDA